MQTMLTAIVTWLSITLDLPAIYDHPRVEFISPQAMYAMRYQGLGLGSAPQVDGLYDDASRTIYLPAGWTGETPAELSVLVHEMVHHLQNAAELTYACPQAREKPAYLAQDRWLALFGRNLMEEFELDPMTVLVRTGCMH